MTCECYFMLSVHGYNSFGISVLLNAMKCKAVQQRIRSLSRYGFWIPPLRHYRLEHCTPRRWQSTAVLHAVLLKCTSSFDHCNRYDICILLVLINRYSAQVNRGCLMMRVLQQDFGVQCCCLVVASALLRFQLLVVLIN
jgi:hypothetical protein